MFRALTCPFSGGKIVFAQHLVSSLSVNVCTVHRLRADNSDLLSSKIHNEDGTPKGTRYVITQYSAVFSVTTLATTYICLQ